MHKTLEVLCNELDQLAAQVMSSISTDEPLGIAHSNWSFPCVTRRELAEAATSIATLIRERGGETLGMGEQLIQDYPRRLQYLRSNTVSNIPSNAGVGVPCFLTTLDSLKQALSSAFTVDPKDEVEHAIRRHRTRVRAMEARLADLEPRSVNLADMVARIEKAHDTADQLPADLQQLSEARQKIDRLLGESGTDRAQVKTIRDEAEQCDADLKRARDEAAAIVERCESAYATATSQGLAAAFADRSKTLDRSMWAWVVGLIAALAVGSIFGSQQLSALSELAKGPSVSGAVIALNVILSLLSVGAPVWFAWLATKQVGQRFRLSEDYAFKASISRAYEGYRREAARIDQDMEASLLGSALSRLDELPLRLVEPVSHGSPWHELLASGIVRDAVKSVPNFVSDVRKLATDSLDKLGQGRRNPSGAQAATRPHSVKPDGEETGT